jgi:hypothetical protein
MDLVPQGAVPYRDVSVSGHFASPKLSLSIAKFESSCQATRESRIGIHRQAGVPSSLALRDTFDGVGTGRKTGSEAEEAIR